MNRYALLLATLVFCAPSRALAQGYPTDSARFAAIAAFSPGRRVRLSVHGDGRAEGTFVDTDSGNIILGVEHWEGRRFAVRAVDSAWVRGNAAGTGALVGGVTGGLLLGSFAAALNSGTCESEGFRCDARGAFVVGGFVGAVLGGVAGALVGLVIPKWHRQLP